MPNTQGKRSRATTKPPKSAARKASGTYTKTASLEVAYAEKPKSKSKGKSIDDAEMRAFQLFLQMWIHHRCMKPNGQRMNQRDIAESLGITQYEVSAWENDNARPGLPRLVMIRKKTGFSIDEILGLSDSKLSFEEL